MEKVFLWIGCGWAPGAHKKLDRASAAWWHPRMPKAKGRPSIRPPSAERRIYFILTPEEWAQLTEKVRPLGFSPNEYARAALRRDLNATQGD